MKSLELERFLPYRLSVLTNLVSNAIAASYRDRFELSVTEWRVIAILGRYPGLSATGVARNGALDKVAVSRAVRRLMDRGLVEREPNDADRRESHLRLSREGEQVHDRIVPEALAFQQRLRAALSDDEAAAFDRILDKLTTAVGAR